MVGFVVFSTWYIGIASDTRAAGAGKATHVSTQVLKSYVGVYFSMLCRRTQRNSCLVPGM